MYRQGDRVLYGTHGVCEIVGTELRRIDRKNVEYFALEPVEQRGTRYYVPTGNPAALAKLQPLLDRDAWTELLHSGELRRDAWIPEEPRRKLRYRELLNNVDRKELLRMIRSLYLYKQQQSAAGRKFHISDENFLRDAEKLLGSELSVVMDIVPGKVGEFLRTTLLDL